MSDLWAERGDRSPVGGVGGRGESKGLSYREAEELETRGEPFVSPPRDLDRFYSGKCHSGSKKGKRRVGAEVEEPVTRLFKRLAAL